MYYALQVWNIILRCQATWRHWERKKEVQIKIIKSNPKMPIEKKVQPQDPLGRKWTWKYEGLYPINIATEYGRQPLEQFRSHYILSCNRSYKCSTRLGRENNRHPKPTVVVARAQANLAFLDQSCNSNLWEDTKSIYCSAANDKESNVSISTFYSWIINISTSNSFQSCNCKATEMNLRITQLNIPQIIYKQSRKVFEHRA